jgi:chemotaxis protein histidine kinase CheA
LLRQNIIQPTVTFFFSASYLAVASKSLTKPKKALDNSKNKPTKVKVKDTQSNNKPNTSDRESPLEGEDGASLSTLNTSTDSNMSIDYGNNEDAKDQDDQESEFYIDVEATKDTKEKKQKKEVKKDTVKRNVGQEKLETEVVENTNKDSGEKGDKGVKGTKGSGTSEDKTDKSYKENEHNRTQSNTQDDNQNSRRYSLRQSGVRGYAEPSLRVKMRRGDAFSNIIPEYVGNPSPLPSSPLPSSPLPSSPLPSSPLPSTLSLPSLIYYTTVRSYAAPIPIRKENNENTENKENEPV